MLHVMRAHNRCVCYPLVGVALTSKRNCEVENPRGLDLQHLFPRRGVCGIGCAAGAENIWVSFGGLHWPLGRLISRGCLDRNLFVVSPLMVDVKNKPAGF